jgi:uncharacterized protein YdgA (DUF945 family)
MKKLVVVIVVLALILLLAPLGVGKIAESRMNSGLDKMAEQMGYLVIAERKWTGGWFKSRQEVTFEVAPAFADMMSAEKLEEIFKTAGDPAAAGPSDADASDADAATDSATTDPADSETGAEEAAASGEETPAEEQAPSAPLRFKVFNDVLHGPVLGLSGLGVARVDTTLDLSEDIKAKLREFFGPKPALEMRTRVGFLGGATTTFTSEGRTIVGKEADDAEVSYETFKLAVGYGRDLDTYDVDGKLPKFQVKEKNGNLVQVTHVTLDGDGKRVKGDLYDGDFAFRIEEIKYDDSAGAGSFSVEDVHYVVETATKDNFVTIGAKMGSGELTSAAVASSGLQIKEIHYDFSMRRLHADSIEKIFKGMREAYSLSPVARTPDAVEAAFIEPMKEHGIELLKHDPEFSIDRIGVVTPEGEGVIKGLIKFVGVTPEDFSSPGAMGVVGKLDADIKVEVAVKLAEKVPNGATMAGAAIDSGYAKRDGEKYVCHIVFKNGELTVNGKPQAIPGLGGPPGGAHGHPGEMPEEGMPEE